jgi:hypothetical protein
MLLCKKLVYDHNAYIKIDEFTDALIKSSNLSKVHFKYNTRVANLVYFLSCLECNNTAKLRTLKIRSIDKNVNEEVFRVSARLVKKHVATLRTLCLVVHVKSEVSVLRLAREITHSSIEKLVWDVIGVDSFTHRFLDECGELTNLVIADRSIDHKFCISLSQNSTLRVITIILCRCLINWYALQHALSLNVSVESLIFKVRYNPHQGNISREK